VNKKRISQRLLLVFLYYHASGRRSGETLFVDVVLDSSAIYRLHVSLTGQDLADGYIHSNAIGKVSFALTTWLNMVERLELRKYHHTSAG
jgi:hypothetical protein